MAYSRAFAILAGLPAARQVVRAVTSASHILLLCLAACGFPRPADIGGSGPGDDDGSGGAETVLRVSPSGDDANDGITQPVKTFKHALGLAALNAQISKVVLASGRYSTESGETFPYMVPMSLTVSGPAGGGAIFAGNGTEPGLTLQNASLEDVEFVF